LEGEEIRVAAARSFGVKAGFFVLCFFWRDLHCSHVIWEKRLRKQTGMRKNPKRQR
jgi:hypothetical protein